MDGLDSATPDHWPNVEIDGFGSELLSTNNLVCLSWKAIVVDKFDARNETTKRDKL